MNKQKAFFIVLALAVIAAVFIGYRNNENNKKEERLAEITSAYTIANNSFYINEECYTAFTVDNVHNFNYLNFAYYEKETGQTMTYEQAFAYFSQEYEEDGSLRLYNNGLHPEIEAYVDFIWGNREERRAYHDEIDRLFGVYYREHRNEGFENSAMHYWSIETLDELIKKEADPEYEMDLLSIQIRERAEAEAQTAV